MRKSNIIIKKVRNLMILSMAVIVIISVYFNILNSISCGVVLARRFGNAHEERSDQNALEKRMDLHNNKVGYDIFKKYSGLDKRSASDKAMDALNNGDLLYEKNGELIPTNQ